MLVRSPSSGSSPTLVVIIVPVLGRPHRVALLLANIRAATPEPYRVVFVPDADDRDTLDALRDARAEFVTHDPRAKRCYAAKINAGVAYTAPTREPWVFTGADDLRFHEAWLSRALASADAHHGVIGTNDLCHPATASGELSTHSLVSRAYVEQVGAVIGHAPGVLYNEEYDHAYCDLELVQTAKHRGLYVHAFDSLVEHLHPTNPRDPQPDDATYWLGSSYNASSRRVLERRRHLWAGTAAKTETARPAPFVEIADALPPDVHAELVDSIAAQLPRATESIDLGEAWKPLEALVHDLGALVRRELGLPHFVLDAVPHHVTVHTPDGAIHSSAGSTTTRATRRVEFVYTVAGRPDVTGGSVRLFDTVMRDGVARAAEICAELPRRDNTLLFFPSDCHHETSRFRASAEGADDAFVCSVRGWLAGDSAALAIPEVDKPTLKALQVRYLPRLTEGGFEVRPIPDPVHRLLSGVLALRSARAQPEHGDRSYLLGANPEIVSVADLAHEILRHLQPLHEIWCGEPLVPTAVYGMRRYHRGSHLAMHVDRLATHVVSSILQISQDVDAPWPIQLDLGGRRESILLEPGEMLLYEGATTPHGRITPLEGREFVNLFVHYRPVEWPWSAESVVERALADGAIDRLGRLR